VQFQIENIGFSDSTSAKYTYDTVQSMTIENKCTFIFTPSLSINTPIPLPSIDSISYDISPLPTTASSIITFSENIETDDVTTSNLAVTISKSEDVSTTLSQTIIVYITAYYSLDKSVS
jgi:hypothetical protein